MCPLREWQRFIFRVVKLKSVKLKSTNQIGFVKSRNQGVWENFTPATSLQWVVGICHVANMQYFRIGIFSFFFLFLFFACQKLKRVTMDIWSIWLLKLFLSYEYIYMLHIYIYRYAKVLVYLFSVFIVPQSNLHPKNHNKDDLTKLLVLILVFLKKQKLPT